MKQIFLIISVTAFLVTTAQKQRIFYNVRELGATADGSTADTKIIKRAIENSASSGGGTIYFPAGIM